MSGIAGIIHFDRRPVAPGEIEAMTSVMACRGPDGISHWRSGHVALGQCMLRSTPESLEEVQPLGNEDNSVILVMDGRVDNWIELRNELLGKQATLRTRADAELVLRAYEVWGEDCVNHIDGDFAFAVWDARQQLVFMARDRFGNRPIVYWWKDASLVFASEVHPILGLRWIPNEVNQSVLADYLAAEWFACDETLWSGVLRLDAAHTAIARSHANRTRNYWQPDPFAVVPCKTDQEHTELYRSTLTDAVRRQSRALHPLACEVSGGLDSSAVFALLQSLERSGQMLAPAVAGYCLDFHGDPDADEADYAKAVGEHWGVPIHLIEPSSAPLEWFRNYARKYRDLPPYPNHEMCRSVERAARERGANVLVSGLGGDEWAGGGNLYYADILQACDWSALVRTFVEDVRDADALRALYRPLRYGAIHLLPASWRRWLRRMPRRGAYEGKNAWLSAEMRALCAQTRSALSQNTNPKLARHSQSMQHSYLTDATKRIHHEMRAQQAAISGIEVRRPFWSRPIVEHAFATPSLLRTRHGQNKWLHRVAMQNLLPEKVLKRRDKALFNAAFAPFFTASDRLVSSQLLKRRANWLQVDIIQSMASQLAASQPVDWVDGSIWVVWNLFGIDSVLAPDSATLGTMH